MRYHFLTICGGRLGPRVGRMPRWFCLEGVADYESTVKDNSITINASSMPKFRLSLISTHFWTFEESGCPETILDNESESSNVPKPVDAICIVCLPIQISMFHSCLACSLRPNLLWHESYQFAESQHFCGCMTRVEWMFLANWYKTTTFNNVPSVQEVNAPLTFPSMSLQRWSLSVLKPEYMLQLGVR